MQHASSVRAFIRHHYRHFNGAALIDAAEGYVRHMDKGGQMFLAMAGAMTKADSAPRRHCLIAWAAEFFAMSRSVLSCAR